MSGSGRRTLLAAREAYALWAATYDAETPVTALDDRSVRALTPPLAGKTLLDAGCGTGRRSAAEGAASVARFTAGVDLVPAMVREGRRRAPAARLAAADLRALPFAAGRFDVVWCRLVLGHLTTLAEAYRELARVTVRDGVVIVTDFHPEAARAGHVRTFRHPDGRLIAVQHHVYEVVDHRAVAAAAGLELTAQLDVAVGPEVRPFYAAAGALDRYAEHCGRPFVLALRFARASPLP